MEANTNLENFERGAHAAAHTPRLEDKVAKQLEEGSDEQLEQALLEGLECEEEEDEDGEVLDTE